MNVLGLISSLTDPSSRARILQYKPYFAEQSINLNTKYFKPLSNADPAKWMFTARKISRINPWRFLCIQRTISRLPLLFQQYHYDLIWQNRLLIPHQSFYEKRYTKPFVFDFDDAIWLYDGKRNVGDAISRSNIVFAGNEYLANFALKYNKETILIPSVIDTKKLFPLNKESTIFTIGWVGSVSNLIYLGLVKDAILEFLAKNPNSRFMVVSSEPGNIFDYDNERILFRKWSAENENSLINEFSVGIMPLTETLFNKGKCSYKMLQYMACGKPVIVSPVGMNNKILSDNMVGFGAVEKQEWFDFFVKFINDKEMRIHLGENGRKVIEEQYSCTSITPKIISEFKKLIH